MSPPSDWHRSAVSLVTRNEQRQTRVAAGSAMIPAMQRRVSMALLSVPLAAAGWLTAHSVAYKLAAPDSHDRAELLSATGHGYLEVESLFVACGLVLVVAGLFASVTEGIRDRPRSRVSVRLFTLVPVLGFAVLEHVERLVEHGAVPYGVALESTFLAGIALQLPFAIAAFSFTRALHALGHALGHLLRCLARPARPLRAAADPLAMTRRIPERARPLASGLAPGHGPRAPPAAAGP
jgi:hypothetical protein